MTIKTDIRLLEQYLDIYQCFDDTLNKNIKNSEDEVNKKLKPDTTYELNNPIMLGYILIGSINHVNF